MLAGSTDATLASQVICAACLTNNKVISFDQAAVTEGLANGALGAQCISCGEPLATTTADASALSATTAAVTHADATGVDLNTVTGSGSGGTITKSDVVAAAAAAPVAPEEESPYASPE